MTLQKKKEASEGAEGVGKRVFSYRDSAVSLNRAEVTSSRGASAQDETPSLNMKLQLNHPGGNVPKEGLLS